MKRALLSGVALIALVSQASAQSRQPAQMTTLPTSTPQEFDLLDKTGAWQRLGYVGANSGAAFAVDQYGTVKGDFVNDDGPAIVAAINAANTAGGGTVLLGLHPYWNQTQNIVVPRTVRLLCAGALPRWVTGSDPVAKPCSIYQSPGLTLEVDGALQSVGVLTRAVHDNPTQSMSRAQMEAFVAGFAGVGITVGNPSSGNLNPRIEDTVIGGFASCIVQDNLAQKVVYRDVLGDCTNGLSIDNSYDNNYLSNIEFWPFLETSRPHAADNWTTSGIASNGSGLWRVTINANANVAPATGEQLWIYPGGGGPQNAAGLWTITAIDATHFDLQGSDTAPATTGTTTSGLTYIPVASTANLAPGMAVSGAGVPAGATIGAVWRTRPAISLDQAHLATASASGVALTFTPSPYGANGNVSYDSSWRNGAGFAFNQADGTNGSGLFDFGHANGFVFAHCTGCSFTNLMYDQAAFNGPLPIPKAANKNVVPTAVQFNGPNVNNVYAQFSMITSNGVAVLNNSGASTVAGNVVSLGRIGSAPNGQTTWLENAAGGLTLRDVHQLNGSANISAILLDASAPMPYLMNNRGNGVYLYGTTVTPLYDIDNNFPGARGSDQFPDSLGAHQLTLSNAGALTNAGSTSLNILSWNPTTPADAQAWRFRNDGQGDLCLEAVNDAFSASSVAWCMARSGASPTRFSLPSIPASAGAGGLAVCVDSAGVLYKKATCP